MLAFAFQVAEQAKFLSKTVVQIAVGTPNRMTQLLENGKLYLLLEVITCRYIQTSSVMNINLFYNVLCCYIMSTTQSFSSRSVKLVKLMVMCGQTWNSSAKISIVAGTIVVCGHNLTESIHHHCVTGNCYCTKAASSLLPASFYGS